jgi:hypothetical protein
MQGCITAFKFKKILRSRHLRKLNTLVFNVLTIRMHPQADLYRGPKLG